MSEEVFKVADQIFEKVFIETLGLTKLREYGYVVLVSAVFFHFVHVASYYLSFSSKHFRKLDEPRKVSWATHIVSAVHAGLICPLSLPIFFDNHLSQDRFFGFTPYSQYVYALSCGYFLWDTYICITEYKYNGFGFVLHGVVCFWAYFLTFRPWLHYYGCIFLTYEISTLFLNVHWFCDKTGLAGSQLQWVNGLFLLFSFFSVRIVFGLYQSFLFVQACLENWSRLPLGPVYFYFLANIATNGLNLFWFSKMISSVMSRFKQEDLPKSKKSE